eukprot:3939357-Rhodomonas_salina.1
MQVLSEQRHRVLSQVPHAQAPSLPPKKQGRKKRQAKPQHALRRKRAEAFFNFFFYLVREIVGAVADDREELLPLFTPRVFLERPDETCARALRRSAGCELEKEEDGADAMGADGKQRTGRIHERGVLEELKRRGAGGLLWTRKEETEGGGGGTDDAVERRAELVRDGRDEVMQELLLEAEA